MTVLSFDYETFSQENLKKVGLSRYARDVTTEVLMAAYRIDKGPYDIWVPAEGQKMPRDFRDALRDPKVIKRAWNAQFERNITKHVLNIDVPIREWRCTMALAFSLALPGSLASCGNVIGLPTDKQKDGDGKRLIKLFCTPRKPTKKLLHTRATHRTDPEKWEKFKDYCIRDVESEVAIYNRLRKWNMSDDELETWFMDQEINEFGIPIKLPMVDNALLLLKDVMDDRISRLTDITGLDNPNSGSQLLPWLREHGYPYRDLKKGHVERALAEAKQNGLSEETRDVLEMRGEISKSSVKKYAELKAATDDDGRLRHCFQYAGASRTRRWSGRRYQPQNLARPVWYLEKHQELAARSLELLSPDMIQFLYDKPMDLLSTCVRPVVQAPEGQVFVDADLNAIENRVIGWIADEQKILDVFRKGRDPYIDFAQYTTGLSYEELWQDYKAGNKATRQLNKPPVLGAGYQLGTGQLFEDPHTGEITGSGLLGYALNMGVKMTEEQSAHAIETWRDTYSEVVEYWKTIERAAKRCIQTGKNTEARLIRFEMDGPFMKMILPSGGSLHYCRPKIKLVKTKFGQKENIVYEGKSDKGKWGEIKTYGGKLVENAVQAVARDLLDHGMKLSRKRGIQIPLHVHDQVVGLVREEHGEEKLRVLIECMSETPRWAEGLPLGAEGHVSKFFIKD